MTTWLEFRTEPAIVAEVEVIRVTTEAVFASPDVPEEFKKAKCHVYEVKCSDENCGESGHIDMCTSHEEAQDVKYNHLKFHEEN